MVNKAVDHIYFVNDHSHGLSTFHGPATALSDYNAIVI